MFREHDLTVSPGGVKIVDIAIVLRCGSYVLELWFDFFKVTGPTEQAAVLTLSSEVVIIWTG